MRSSKDNDATSRHYINKATKAAVHPVRKKILQELRKGSRTATELGELLDLARYNLYHHLDELINLGLVTAEPIDGKTNSYRLLEPRKPEVAVLVFEEEEIHAHPEAFEHLVDSVEEIEGTTIPHRARIRRAEVYLYYSWE